MIYLLPKLINFNLTILNRKLLISEFYIILNGNINLLFKLIRPIKIIHIYSCL